MQTSKREVQTFINVYICPECGADMKRNSFQVLGSYPPQAEYKCVNCTYAETAQMQEMYIEYSESKSMEGGE